MMNFRDYNNGSLLTYLSNLYMGRYYSYMNRDEFNNIKMLQRQLAEMPEGFNTRENLVRLLGEDGFSIFDLFKSIRWWNRCFNKRSRPFYGCDYK